MKKSGVDAGEDAPFPDAKQGPPLGGARAPADGADCGGVELVVEGGETGRVPVGREAEGEVDGGVAGDGFGQEGGEGDGRAGGVGEVGFQAGGKGEGAKGEGAVGEEQEVVG